MLAETLAWTLIHFLWQGVLIGLLLAIVLWFAPADDVGRSNYRYGSAMLALALVILAPLLTFFWQWLGQGGGSVVAFSHSSMAMFAVIDAAVAWHMPPLLLRLLLACWAAGVSWYAMKMLLAWVALQYLQRTQVHATPQWVARQVETLAEQMSIMRPVRIIVSGVINTPMTLGWLRPIIILPVTLLTGMQMDQLRLLLAHELAHIRRHDYVVNMVQNMVRILLFYHPLVHWICRILDEERELCCDHIALECSSSRMQYAKALLSLQEQPHPLPALAAASTSKHALLRRIRRILGEPAAVPRNDLRQRPLLCLTSLLVSLAVFMSGFSGIDYSRAAIRVMPENNAQIMLPPARHQPQFLLDELYQRTEGFQHPVAGDDIQPQHIATQQPLPSAPLSTPATDEPEKMPTPMDQEIGVEPSAAPVATGAAELRVEDLQQQHRQRQQQAMRLDRASLQRELRTVTNERINSLDIMQASSAEIDHQAELLAAALTDTDYSLRADTLPEPVHQVRPRLPVRLLDNDMVVIVNLVYSINAAGKPADILVAEDSDQYDGAFARAAADALRQWQYPPVSEQLQQMRIKQQFVFMQPPATRRCVTGSRICERENYTVEQVIINSG